MLTIRGERFKKIIIIGGGIVFLFVILAVISAFFKKPSPPKITLKVWGFDSEEVMNPIFSAYQNTHKNISFVYTKKDYENYEHDLLEAMASGNSPDIFLIHNNWLPRYEDKIHPLETKYFSAKNISDAFVDCVYRDFVKNQKIWALPSYVDTLAMYYNATVFNANNIATPPKTWQGFTKVAKKLTLTNQSTGTISRPGAAIGSAENINRAPDIFNLIMLQEGINKENLPAKREKVEEALKFYTDFARPDSGKYVWDKSLHYSIDSFAEEEVPIIFNYHYQERYIREKNPHLDFKIAKMPQFDLDKPVNYPNYWAWSVSLFSRYPKAAWTFILNLTNNPLAEEYLKATKKPPALRILVKKYLDDPDLGVFASQSLSAKSLEEENNESFEETINKVIEEVLNGRISTKEAVDLIETRI